MTKGASSDPFFRIVSVPSGLSYPITLYRSEVVKQDVNPSWNEFVLNVADVRGFDEEFTIECYDWDAVSTHLDIHLFVFQSLF